MAGDWRISADDRTKYDSYFQQCNPKEGIITGDEARKFFVKSGLSSDILRKIWDLSDITNDGCLDKREFTIACHLISSQVQKKIPLPATLPPTLLSDAITITSNGVPPSMPILPLSTIRPSFNSWGATNQPLVMSQLLKSTTISPAPLTPTIRSKYLQQFHSLVDVTKTNGFMSGSQAKNILQQTGLSQTFLHQIWTLADHDKDGRLTSDEFVIAMHCCDIVRAGQTLPTRLPDEWLHGNMPRDRTGSLAKPNISQAFVNLNQELKDAFKISTPPEIQPAEPTETERKNSIVTYEEKRLKNYEDGYRELERRRQLLHEQEIREQRERDERERKREFDLQKQKDDVERKKQMEFERQLERQKQIEHQKEEERRKLFEQRETARKEMERRSRLEWERQRMQELSTQKSRLFEQINDLKSREKALGLELQSMDDTIQSRQGKFNQINTTIHTIDQSIDDIQKRTIQERNLLENFEQQKKDIMIKWNKIQVEKESIGSSLQHMNQSKEFSSGAGNRESDQMRFVKLQLENVKQESTRADEQITNMNIQCKQYQNQMEQLRVQLAQLEQNAKNQKSSNNVTTPTPVLSNYEQFRASNDLKSTSSTFAIAPPSTLDVDPFQTVDPFASQSDIGTPTNNDWYQPSNNGTTTNDPFVSKTEISSKNKKFTPKSTSRQTSAVDPWGGSTNTTNGNGWAPFNNTTTAFGTTNEWPNGNSSAGTSQYRALYDYAPARPDELGISAGDIITVDTSQQQDDNWLFGKLGNDKEGFFPTAYAERIAPSTPSSANGNSVDTTSQLTSGSSVITLADCQGKTADKHLSFQKGELILVREQKDATWYSGQLRGKIGWFPRNYVRPANEVEIQNNKNTTKNTPASPLNSPASPNGVSSKDNNSADVYVSIYPYNATDSGDLSFAMNERIIVLKREGEWWTGKIGDRVGTFPNNYVQKVDNPLQETALATAPFQSNDENRLSFDRGQIIYIRKKGDKGWYQGEIRTPDQPVRVGWFPANCVQLQTNSSPSTPVTSYQNTSEYPRYIAEFPYEAQQDDELTFPAQAILEILDTSGNAGWFKARYNNQTGLIPSTYVKPIDESTP